MYEFGAKEKSEDFVQEMYLKVLQKNCEDKIYIDGEINKRYVYFILRNMYIDSIRKHRSNTDKMNIINIDDKLIEKITQFNEDKHISKKIYLEAIQSKIMKEIYSWHWYDIMLFFMIVNSNKSIRTISRESTINRSYITKVLKQCKDNIKKAVGEDYEDYTNEDYDKILDEVLRDYIFKRIKNL